MRSVVIVERPESVCGVTCKPEDLPSVRFDEIHQVTAEEVQDISQIFRTPWTSM
jgi:hypothetical protein